MHHRALRRIAEELLGDLRATVTIGVATTVARRARRPELALQFVVPGGLLEQVLERRRRVVDGRTVAAHDLAVDALEARLELQAAPDRSGPTDTRCRRVAGTCTVSRWTPLPSPPASSDALRPASDRW